MRRLLVMLAVLAIGASACGSGTGGPSLNDTQTVWCAQHDMTPDLLHTVGPHSVDDAVLDSAVTLHIQVPSEILDADTAFQVGNSGVDMGPLVAGSGWPAVLDSWRKTPDYATACAAAYQSGG